MNATVFTTGAIDTNPGCALLPYTPQSGCVYFMNASLTLPAGMGNWVAMGFTSLATQTNNATGSYCRFTDNPPAGYAWMAMKAATAQGVYAGRGTASPMGNTTVVPASTTNLTIVLNTVVAPWTVSAYLGGTIAGTNVVGGTQMGTNFTYASDPAIAYAGIGQTSLHRRAIRCRHPVWNYWTLSVTQLVAAPVITGNWVAPAATGTGDGSTSANAASYQDNSFWNTIQSQLQNSNVTVNFVNGNYTVNTLGFTNMGNPLHQLVLSSGDAAGRGFQSQRQSHHPVHRLAKHRIERHGVHRAVGLLGGLLHPQFSESLPEHRDQQLLVIQPDECLLRGHRLAQWNEKRAGL